MLSIIPGQTTAVCSHPHVTPVVCEERSNIVVGQAAGIPGIVTVVPEFSGAGIELIQPGIFCSDPDESEGILAHGEYPLSVESAAVHDVASIEWEFLHVRRADAEAIGCAEPEDSAGILEEGCHNIIGEGVRVER
jgi:hypothetical protein